MSTKQFFSFNKLLIAVIGTFLLLPVGAQAEIISFTDDFDGPSLDPVWATNGNAANHIGIGGGVYRMTSQNGAVTPTGTSIQRNIDDDGTVGDFIASVTIQADPFIEPDNSFTDFKWKFFGPDGFVELVWNSNDNVRVFHNDSSTSTGANVFASGNDHTGFTDGDSIEFQMTYESDTETLSVGYSLNNDPFISLYAGLGNGDGIDDAFTNFTVLEVFQFNGSAAVDPVISVDSYSLVPLVAVPEPGSLALASSVMMLLGFRRRRTNA